MHVNCIVLMAYKRKRTATRVRRRIGRRLRGANGIVSRDGMRNAAVGLAAGIAGRVIRNVVKGRATGMLNRRTAVRNMRISGRNAALTRKRRSRVKSTGCTERVRTSTVWGRRPRGLMQRWQRKQMLRLRLTYMGLNRTDQYVDNTTTCPGFFNMSNNLGNAEGVDATSGIAPVYVLSLNNTVQNGVYAAPFRRVQVDSTGRVQFIVVNGQNTGGGSTTLWQNEGFNAGADPGGECQHIVNEWQSVKLCMYGARQQQTRYKIHLVQCNEMEAAPEDEPDLLAATGSLAERVRDAYYAWWQNLIRPLVTTEIAAKFYPARPRTGNVSPFTILKTWTYNIACSLTTERDSTASAVVAKLFIRDGRVMNYNWQQATAAYDSTRTTAVGGIDDLIILPSRQEDMTRTSEPPLDQPHPKARRYLIITCDNTTPVVLNAETQDNTPSFDLLVRKSEIRGLNTQT